LAGVWSHAVGFVLVKFGRNVASSVAITMFSYFIYFINIHKFCTFSPIFRGNAAISRITAQHTYKKVSSRKLRRDILLVIK
jgi:hypothetical protein